MGFQASRALNQPSHQKSCITQTHAIAGIPQMSKSRRIRHSASFPSQPAEGCEVCHQSATPLTQRLARSRDNLNKCFQCYHARA